MTFKDLKRLFPSSESESPESNNTQQQQQEVKNLILLNELKGLDFWIENPEVHKKKYIETNQWCCYNHAISLPIKNRKPTKIFDYELEILHKLLDDAYTPESSKDPKARHLWVKKSTGLGLSELLLRIMSWLALKDNRLSGTEMVIITAPRLQLSVSLIDRLKKLFLPKLGITFNSKETVVTLNNVKIQAFPSHNLSAMRGIPNVSFCFCDEADYFERSEFTEVRNVIERYVGKSNSFICMVSTPAIPDGLFSQIEAEPEDKTIYKRLFMDFTVGLGKIYTEDDILKAKMSPSFEQEYNLKYMGFLGNVFHTRDINAAVERGNLYKVPETVDDVNYYTKKSMGIDPGFGSSAFGLCVLEQSDRMINVLEATEYVRPDYNQMISVVWEILRKYGKSINKIYVDGANPSFIRGLKLALDEDENFEQVVKDCKAAGRDLEMDMTVIPVNFSTEHKEMLGKLKTFMEKDGGYMAINSKFTKLISSLRTATEKGEGSLDKDMTSYNDIFDALRLALVFYDFRSSEEINRRVANVQNFEFQRRFYI